MPLARRLTWRLPFDPMHQPWCRTERHCPDRFQDWGRGGGETTHRQATELEVPVPTVLDALGQHHTARVLRHAGYDPRPPYQKEA